MALAYTTTELLTNIREAGRLADDDPSATDAILLRIATQILHDTYVPAVRKQRADFYTTRARITLEASRASYPIPRRAVVGSVRRVRLLQVSDGRLVHELAPVSVEDVDDTRTSPAPTHYAVTDDQIRVWPMPATGATSYALEVMYEYRPGQLVAPSACFLSNGYVWNSPLYPLSHLFSFDPAPGVAVGTRVDVVSRDAPFSARLIDATVETTILIGTGYVLRPYSGVQEAVATSGLDADPVYMCLAGETPIPQIPAELHPCLATHAAAQAVRAYDPEGSALLQADADTRLGALLDILAPRKVGVQQKLKPRNSMLRGRGGRRSFLGDIR